MMNHRRHSEAAQRQTDRRQREDEAPRLLTEVPRLTGLKLEIQENRGGGLIAEAGHVRRIVIENAPALCMMSCADRSCKDGGHDLTWDIMRALKNGQTRFEGEHTCDGQLGTATCNRLMRYVGIATFRDE